MTRPKKEETLAKTKDVHLRMNETEYDLLAERAKANSMTVSDFIRNALVNQKVGRPKEPPLESPSEPYVSLSTHTAPSPTDGNIPNFQCANKFLSLLATAPSQCSALLLVFFFL